MTLWLPDGKDPTAVSTVSNHFSFVIFWAALLCVHGSCSKWRSLGIVDGASLSITAADWYLWFCLLCCFCVCFVLLLFVFVLWHDPSLFSNNTVIKSVFHFVAMCFVLVSVFGVILFLFLIGNNYTTKY